MISAITKPMLAEPIKKGAASLKYPLIVSPKLNGIRFVKSGGRGLSKSFKLIRNDYIRTTLERLCPDGMDGELMAGNTFQACDSAVMTIEGEPDFKLWAFDLVVDDLLKPYVKRLDDLNEAVYRIDDSRVISVPVRFIANADDLMTYEEECLALGFEGVMVRDPNGPYKCGRSTVKEGWLLKLKRFVDSEAIINGFAEQMHNENKAEKNEIGRTHRSSAKAGKVPAGTLGAFLASDEKVFPGIKIRIGSGEGLTAELRKEIWDNRESYLGKMITYCYQEDGIKDGPRHPTFKGFRSPDDMSE
jgi:DNA ligase-1